MHCTIRPYQAADRDAVDRVALAAFPQFAYADWPAFSARIARTSELAGQAELLVADIDGEVRRAVLHAAPGKPRSPFFPDDWVASALRLYTTLGFTRDRDLDPIDGVAYGRYVLPAELVPAVLDRLLNWPA